VRTITRSGAASVLGAAGAAILLAGGAARASAQGLPTPNFPGRPDAVIDLADPAGVRLVKGQWRYSDARIVEIDSRGPGADLRATGAPVRAYDIEPKAGAADFDDSRWEILDPPRLDTRRSAGRLAFNWYRLTVTVPERVGTFDPTGSTVVFEVVVDDYAEVWVDGKLPLVLGRTGGPVVGGFNAPNRVVVGRDVRPGQQIRIALFGANGPLSSPPSNFIWIRSATLDFHQPPPPSASAGRIIREHPALDSVVSRDARIEKIATGFIFTEGPVWVPDGGYLLFSDPNANRIYRWSEDDGVSVFRTKSGYAGVDIAEYKQPGSNGLTIDRQGRLTVDEHGNRRVVRIERTGAITVLADRYQGKRLNSPNDLVYRSDGSLYFTDPAFGLPRVYDDPRKELPFQGVYRWADGALTLLTSELKGPNGIAFSPDERYLYVGNWDEARKVVMRYEVKADGTLAPGTVFADLTSVPGEDAIDGVKVDRAGHVFVSGPGGIWVFAPDGIHLGTIVTEEHAHNLAFGDDDGRTLYLTGQTSVYRVRLNVEGVRPPVTSP
jgi:gluconolactonase